MTAIPVDTLLCWLVIYVVFESIQLYFNSQQALLGYGADPRIYADDGQSPEHVCNIFVCDK